MQVQHPRATDADPRDPPSRVSIPGHGNVSVGGDGYLAELDESTAKRAMDALGAAYDVEYTDDGSVVAEGEICGAEMGDGSTCKRPADECPYHGEEA